MDEAVEATGVRPRRLLVVDDDPDIVDLLMQALAEEGYSTRSASNGEEALRRVAEAPPDLILLDMAMPVMDGAEFAAAYQAQPPPHAPIICVTAAQNAQVRCAGVGAAAVVDKPFQLDDLIDLIDSLLHAGAPCSASATAT